LQERGGDKCDDGAKGDDECWLEQAYCAFDELLGAFTFQFGGVPKHGGEAAGVFAGADQANCGRCHGSRVAERDTDPLAGEDAFACDAQPFVERTITCGAGRMGQRNRERNPTFEERCEGRRRVCGGCCMTDVSNDRE
jgi:hypothetical protein